MRGVDGAESESHPLEIDETNLPSVRRVRRLAEEDVRRLGVAVNHRAPLRSDAVRLLSAGRVETEGMRLRAHRPSHGLQPVAQIFESHVFRKVRGERLVEPRSVDVAPRLREFRHLTRGLHVRLPVRPGRPHRRRRPRQQRFRLNRGPFLGRARRHAAGMNVAWSRASARNDARVCDGVSNRSCPHPCPGAKSSSSRANLDSMGAFSHGRNTASKHRGTRTPASASAAVTGSHARNAASTAADLTSLAIFIGCVAAFARAYSRFPSSTFL